MLKSLKEFSKLKNEWKKRWKKEIVDIFIFGSFVRGKYAPNDIDICLVFRKNIDLEITKKIKSILGENYHVSSLSVDNFFTDVHSLAKTMLLEGISLISGKSLADSFALKAKLLYSYDLSKEKPSKKVRIVYLLRGRKKDGLVKKLNGEFISNNSFIIPVESDKEIQEILDKWQVKYKRMAIMLMD